MGVPTVTLLGDRFCSRHSASHLRNAGLGELVANDLGGYLKIAVGLAKDPDRLSEMRAGMREKIAESPLLDGQKFTENFSRMLRSMWRDTGEFQSASQGAKRARSNSNRWKPKHLKSYFNVSPKLRRH